MRKGLTAEEALTIDREKTNPLQAEAQRAGLRRVPLLVSPLLHPHHPDEVARGGVAARFGGERRDLLLKKVQGFAPDLTVGLSDKSVQACTFSAAEPFAAEFLQPRKAVAIDRNPAEMSGS